MTADTLAASHVTHCAPVAQRLEQQTHNLLVRGSNPCGGTIYVPDPTESVLTMLTVNFMLDLPTDNLCPKVYP
jgi:hypothetical protein